MADNTHLPYLANESKDYWTREISKGAYSYVHYFLRRYVRQSSRVVDFGAEMGRLSLALMDMGHDVFAIDLHRSALRFAKTKATIRFGKDLLHAVCADARMPPFALTSFDACLFARQFLAMFHGREERRRLLKQSAELLKSGGVVVLSIQNGAFRLSLKRVIYEGYLRTFVFGWWRSIRKMMQPKAWKSIARIFRSQLFRPAVRRGEEEKDYWTPAIISEKAFASVAFHDYSLAEIIADLEASGFEICEVRDILETERPLELPDFIRQGAPFIAILARKRT